MEVSKTSPYANGDSKSEDKQSDAGSTSSQIVCGSCRRRLRSWIPPGFKDELGQLLKLAGPVVISQLMIFLISFVSTVFCGHLGKTELAGVALAIAVINVTGISIGSGLASACDTLISQTFGSNNLKRVGVIVQRSVLIQLLACCPCWALLINTEPILLLVRQSPQVASLSQMYVKIFMPALPAAFMYQLLGRYLQNQGIIWPLVGVGIAGNILNAVINYVFLYVLDLGVAGSAAANSISQYALAVFLYIYIVWKGLHKATWDGWSKDCLQEWGGYINLALPSMLMLCVEWWTYEIGGFLAGLISEVELGAQSIVYEVATIAYMSPLGFSVAASVRVGTALGAGNTEQAIMSGKVAVVSALSVSCVIAVLIGASKDVIGYVFTTDQEIVNRVSDIMVMYGFFHLFDAMAGVCGGILRGAGKQLFGALGIILSYYFVGFPIGVSLMFAAKMGIIGLWTGLFVCGLLSSLVFIILLVKLDWKKITIEAQERAGVEIQDVVLENKAVSDTNENEEDLPDQTQTQVETPTDVEGISKAESGKEAEVQVVIVGDVLSNTQLVLRRGGAIFVMLLVLAAGILINEILTGLLRGN
ncbi:multidrug and toxin extrusion protein 1 [Clupea harengus]|uniref:Multidrug and toxin extrusion protein n=1 Tax=Clupea harengus TaxID=7950 RepID=A0A6P8FQ27_CLUHA|nr:multidrug and toxin extrusion protein 1 [Clupea harengus]